MPRLFDNAEDSDSDLNLKTDTDFAKNYDKWRQKEELHKLQMKYGDEVSESESSSEDDEGDEINDQFEKDFFRMLSCLKSKDPRIYDKNHEFFENENVAKASTKKKKEQPMYLKDYERRLILEKGGKLSDEEEESLETQTPTYIEEQKELKENLKKALNNVNDSNEEKDEEWGGMFKTRQKTTEEKHKEEEDYLQWLAGQTEDLEDKSIENDLKPLKEYWTNSKLDTEEKFLRDYVLKKKFLDSEEANYIPSYDEVIHDSDKDLSEDEKLLDEQEEFEHKYNFRFEEPDQDFIKRYPRTMENSLRRKDDKRITKRSERKERKMKEKEQKMEELRQLQNFKKKEIEEKIKQLNEITGSTEVEFDVNDIEDDFDPEKHDKRMKALFDDEFYKGPEGEQKPEFPDFDKELELENWDHWHGDEKNDEEETTPTDTNEVHCEDDNFNMDCDYDPSNTQKELIENSKRKKKRKRKSKFAEVLSQPKPAFDPTNKTYEEYIDEYYKLDYEDIIGDVPCRFKYREVVPNSFGLSVEEILAAKDKELNRWCSLKKAIQYRPEHVEKYDVIAFEKKGKNMNLKRKYLPSLFTEEKAEDIMKPSTSSEGTAALQKTPKQVTVSEDIPNEEIINQEETNNADKSEKSAKKRKKKEIVNQESSEDLTEKETNKDDTKMDVNNKKNVKNKILSDSIKENETNKTSKKKRKHKENHSDDSSRKKLQGNNVKQNGKAEMKLKHKDKTKEIAKISDARLAAYGINAKKFKNKMKYGNINGTYQ